MKKIAYILFTAVILLTACTEDYVLEDRELSVDELPAYVAFSAPGANISVDPIETNEDGGTVALNVEVPGGTVSDVTVNFTFGGTAVYGVDFEVPNGSSAGGSIVIPHVQTTDPADLVFDNANIEVTLLKDNVVDGTKTLEVILSSASNANGELAVGRGGTDLLKTQTITILDFCELTPATIEGTWGLEMQDSFGDGWNGASVTFEIDGIGIDYTILAGSSGSASIIVPPGAQTLRFFYNSGAFDEEVTFQILSPNGNEVGSFGPNPPIGELTIDACAL
ncbi:MAG: hypothetical protein KJO12_09170 [Ignavibacteria bacterium]|nr:hypothetical protein [Ignavibacteria bacterium]